MLTDIGIGQEDRVLSETRNLMQTYGSKTAHAFIAIADGRQPDPLAKRRIMNSPAGVLLLTQGNATLQFARGYLLAAKRIEINGTRCLLRAVEPVLPDPDSKPPRAP